MPKSDFMESIAAFLDNSDTSKELFFGNPAEKIFDNSGNFADTQKIGPEKDDSTIRSSRIAQDISEVRIAGNKYKGLSFYKFVDFLIRGTGFNITDIHNLVPGFFKYISNRTGAVCINENFHGLHGRLDNQFLFVSQKGSVKDTGADILICKRSKFSFNIFGLHFDSQRFKYDIYRSACSLNARPSMLDSRVYADMLCNHLFGNHIISSMLSKAYHILENLSSKAYAEAE